MVMLLAFIAMEGNVYMRKNVHIIMGLTDESVGPAKELQERNEVVFILDHTVKGVQKEEGFTFVDRAFVDTIDYTAFKVYAYEAPYKRPQLLQGSKSFMMEKNGRSR